ncbi:unnamed protein product [Penicillium nalgiovense]|uniref:Uncharacterized protein n=1 Tax=Penicillium nalgiovense TaxID=60175 RepID=A0A9W4MMH2_PENNA|nr:unnamed protein product [Penicillium nalgiovense]CAG7977504.1 unnamed protein product [Penicillium nalgiovense]CAG7979559.1 unnamed protein product [Penicillium nalgiovense]CAG7979659.1 unnamed protein product [Penicillium nalgiovense]CAG7980933.1 unnamed protein product [Penicillium nalgiovense]
MIYLSKSLFYRTMLFCLSQRRAREPLKPPSDLDYPLMDLSSLEGAPIINPKFIVPPDTTTPRIRTQSRASIQYLFSKPLPPRPASTDGISPTQHRSPLQDWPLDLSTIDGNLQRASARRRTRAPPDEVFPDCDPRGREVRPRIQHIPHPPVRPRSCVPLTWLEDEKKWMVGEIYMPRTHDPRPQDDIASSRSPVSPISPISPWQDMFQRLDAHIEYNNRLCRENLLRQTPSYDGHRSSQTHDPDLGDDRVSKWVATARRMHENRQIGGD